MTTWAAGVQTGPKNLVFYTDGYWSVYNMLSFQLSVETAYNVIQGLEMVHVKSATVPPSDPLPNDALNVESILKAVPRVRKGRSGPPSIVEYDSKHRGAKLRAIDAVALNVELVKALGTSWYDPLRIRAIEMRSPGFMVLSGSIAAITVLRALIKDLRFRNRQEEEMGDLRIAAATLVVRQLADRASSSDPTEQTRTIRHLAGFSGDLLQLQKYGLLREPAEPIDDSILPGDDDAPPEA